MAEVERAKGTREVNPEDKLLMNHVVDNLRRIFELYFEIKINNREILDAIMKYAGIDSSKIETIILTIDKLDKIHEEGVKKELKEKNLDEDQIERIFNIISIKGSNKDKIIRLKDLIEDNEGIKEIEELIQYCPNVFLDLSLARGLAYYTGTIFEIFSKSGKSAICSGGRYDNMIGNFLGNKQKYPAVGISFGLDRIALLLKKEKKTTVKVYIIPIKTTEQSFKLLNNIRDDGINADIDIMGRNISKNLDYANVLSIPYVIFIGDDEIKLQKYKLRDMKTGKEELLNYQQLINKLK